MTRSLDFSPPIPSSVASDGYRGAATTFLKLIKVARGETVGWQEGDFLGDKILFRKIATRVAVAKTQNATRDEAHRRENHKHERREMITPEMLAEAHQEATLRCPRNRMLVRCCTLSTHYALSAAAVWPPAGLPDGPLLENAS